MSDLKETYAVGKKLVELCNAGKGEQALEELYAEDIVSIEVMGNEQMPARMEGIAAVKGKNEWWFANHEVHSFKADGPYPHGDRFIVKFEIDVTSKPMGNQRFQMEEMGLYTVKNGKVVQEEFFYHMPGCE